MTIIILGFAAEAVNPRTYAHPARDDVVVIRRFRGADAF